MKNVLLSTDLKELYDLAYIGVLVQGHASMEVSDTTVGDSCAYMGKGDLNHIRCGVGHTLSDDFMLAHASKFQGYVYSLMAAADSNVFDMRLLGNSDDDTLLEFLDKLQCCHDDALVESLACEYDVNADEKFVALFRTKMHTLAESRGLSSYPLPTADNILKMKGIPE